MHKKSSKMAHKAKIASHGHAKKSHAKKAHHKEEHHEHKAPKKAMHKHTARGR